MRRQEAREGVERQPERGAWRWRRQEQPAAGDGSVNACEFSGRKAAAAEREALDRGHGGGDAEAGSLAGDAGQAELPAERDEGEITGGSERLPDGDRAAELSVGVAG